MTSDNDRLTHHVGDWPEVNYTKAYVVYESKTGKVVHIHEEIIFEGAEGLDTEGAESQALEFARRFTDVSDLHVLAVEPREVAGGQQGSPVELAVNLNDKTLTIGTG